MTEKPSSGLNKIKFFDDGLEKIIFKETWFDKSLEKSIESSLIYQELILMSRLKQLSWILKFK